MGLKLNRLEDVIIDEMLGRRLAALNRQRGASVPGSPRQRAAHLRSIGETALEVGLIEYQRGEPPGVVRDDLRLAGRSLLEMFSLREPPDAEEYRNAAEAEPMFDLVAGLGDPAQRAAAGALEEWRYAHPPDLQYRPFAEDLLLLQATLAGRPLDHSMAGRIEEYCQSDHASREDRTVLLPEVQGLSALDRHDPTAWASAIDRLAEAHALEAARGVNRRSLDAFLCLPALALVGLGRGLGLQYHGTSPYVPVALLEPSP